MGDVQGLLKDPDFNQLSPQKQRETLGKVDPAFAGLTDDQYQKFRSRVGGMKEPGQQEQKTPVVPSSYPSWKPQELTGKDIKAAGVNAIPTAVAAGGALVGGIPGAAVGGMAGEAAKEAVVSKVGQENLSGNIFKVDAPPGSVRELEKRVVIEGAEQGGMEAAGALSAKLLRGVLGGAMHAETKEYANSLIKEINEKYGLNLTAQEVTNTGRMTQRIGEYSILSQGYIRRKWGEGAARGLSAIDDVLGHLYPATSPEETGKAVQGMFKLSSDLYQREAQNIYEQQLKPAAKNVLINMRPVKKAAQDMLDKIAATKAQYGKLGGIGGKGEEMLKNIVESSDDVPFELVHEMRSNLMKVSPDVDALMSDKVQGAAKRLVKETTDAMDVSLTSASPQIKQLWQDARAFYKEGAELFDHEAIQGMMSRDPVGLVSTIKPHDTDMAVRVRDAILKYPQRYGTAAEKQEADLTWRQFQEQFTRSRIMSDPEHVGVAPNPEALAAMSDRIDQLGPGVLREIYGNSAEGREALTNLTTIGQAFKRVNQLPVEGRKYVYDALMLIAGALPGVYGHSMESAAFGAATFESLPFLISATVHSKAGTNFLLDGIGGLVRAAKNHPMQAIGKGLIKLQDKTITSDASYKYLGKAMADIGRAYAVYKTDRDKMDAARKKNGAPDGKVPPGAGNQQDQIHLMLQEWQK